MDEQMNDNQPSYIFRTVDLSPAEATRAFDRVARTAGLTDGRLTLERPGSPVAPEGALAWPLRTATGRLQLGLGRSVPVELALSPWSNTKTEVSIRPTTRSAPRGNAYGTVASQIVERIVAAIEARATGRLVAAGAGAEAAA
jgi:hypothetical protein